MALALILADSPSDFRGSALMLVGDEHRTLPVVVRDLPSALHQNRFEILLGAAMCEKERFQTTVYVAAESEGKMLVHILDWGLLIISPAEKEIRRILRTARSPRCEARLQWVSIQADEDGTRILIEEPK